MSAFSNTAICLELKAAKTSSVIVMSLNSTV